MVRRKTQAVNKIGMGDRIISLVFAWRRFTRLVFPSPAEVRFVEIMRGKAWTVPFIRSTYTGFPLVLLWRGHLLRNELVDREVKIGRFVADFATPRARYKKVIEIDGAAFHDIVRDQDRDDYFHSLGWQVMRIKAKRLWREPHAVYVEVVRFLRA